LALPDWFAIVLQVPALLPIVNVAPTFVHSPELLKETGNPELAVAATVKLLL
jgi:hypothetical protein